MIELFACKPHNIRLSTKACGLNWKMVNRGTATPMPSIGAPGGSRSERVYGRAQCVGCDVGAAHARGEVVPVERLVWKAPAAAAAPPPPPATVVPRVEGVLDDKRATRTAPTPWERERHEHEEQIHRARTAQKEEPMAPRFRDPEERAAAVAKVAGGASVADVAREHEVSQQSIRNWIAAERAAAAAELERALETPAAHAPSDTHQIERDVTEPAAREPANEDDDEPSMGDVILPPPLESRDLEGRAMDRTELDLDTPIPFRPIEMISIPFEVASILASLGITSAIVHVAHLIYEVGHAYGRGAPDEAKAWTDRAKVASYRARG